MMNDSRRHLLSLLVAVQLVVGVTAAIFHVVAPARASTESPLLVAAPTTTSTMATTSTAAVVETTAAPVEVRAPTFPGGAVVPPKDNYAPEPIQEIGTIEIPKIGLVHKIMQGVTLRNIDFGPSHWPGTPLPGQAGNSVFAGHRVTHTHPFRRINELEPGDEIFFTVAGVRSRYVVTGHEVVSPSRVDIVYPTATPTVTLFACHPPGSARQRYVVRGALAPLDAASAPAPAASPPAGPAPDADPPSDGSAPSETVPQG
jgi:sortase A